MSDPLVVPAMNPGAREKVRRVAEDVSAGRVGITAGCRRMMPLLRDADLHDDPDALTILGVESETDVFALPEQAHLWEPQAFREQDDRRVAYENLVREQVLAACVVLVRKLAPAT